VPVRRIVTDVDLGALPDDVEVVAPPAALGPWAAHEVLVVSADAEVHAAAGPLGVHRIVADGADVGDAVRQFVDFLDR
jgi:hypothetical protein